MQRKKRGENEIPGIKYENQHRYEEIFDNRACGAKQPQAW